MGLLALVWVTAAWGCASDSGWHTSESRTCAPESAPRVCAIAEPDYGHVIGLGDVELLPGECVVAADDARAGLIRVHTRSRQSERRARWLATRKGKVTLIEVDAAGKIDAARQTCDQTPVSLSERQPDR